jgi:hypothetical protein
MTNLRASDPHAFVPVRVGHDDQTLVFGDPGRQESLFLARMIWVINRDRQRITKHTRRLIERDSVLCEIPLRLLRAHSNCTAADYHDGGPNSMIMTAWERRFTHRRSRRERVIARSYSRM